MYSLYLMKFIVLTMPLFPKIYSVRVRDKGPDYRGFVQIPLIQSVDGSSGDIFIGAEPLGDPMLLLQMGARCYVEPCQRKVDICCISYIYI